MADKSVPSGREVARFVSPLVGFDADDIIGIAIVALTESGEIQVACNGGTEATAGLLQAAAIETILSLSCRECEAENDNPLASIDPDTFAESAIRSILGD